MTTGLLFFYVVGAILVKNFSSDYNISDNQKWALAVFWLPLFPVCLVFLVWGILCCILYVGKSAVLGVGETWLQLRSYREEKIEAEYAEIQKELSSDVPAIESQLDRAKRYVTEIDEFKAELQREAREDDAIRERLSTMEKKSVARFAASTRDYIDRNF